VKFPHSERTSGPAHAVWIDPVCPLPVEYSREAIEHIRLSSIENLLALPRFGMGSGGLLLGTRDAANIRILDSVPIPCSHALGPSFALTGSETEQARALAETAGTLQIVGMYCSKTRGPLTMNDAEQELFRLLCPETWQIALLIKPSTVTAVRSVLSARDSAARLVTGEERDLERWDQDSLDEKPQAPLSAGSSGNETASAAVAPASVVIPVVVPAALPAVIPTVVPAAASDPAKIEKPAPVATPLFRWVAPEPKNKHKLWLTTTALAVACAAGLFTMRDSLLPRPSLKLDAAEANGHLMLRWNRAAVRGLDRGSLSVDDGGELKVFPLDGGQLNEGVMRYDRKSERVTAVMKAGDSMALTSFVGPRPVAAPASTP
jgi:hypothetical protein